MDKGGMGGQLHGDYVGRHCNVGRAKRVTTLIGSTELPLYCNMEGDKLEFPSRP